MAKFNLSEAAKDILQGNVSAKQSGHDKPQKLNTNVVTGQQDVGKIGDSPNDVNDTLPDYTKGTPTATPPGAKPPVGSEPMKKLGKQPAEDKAGDTGAADMGGHQGSENSYDSIRDRKAGTLAKQTMTANKGATFQQYEETESEEEEVVTEEEHEDAAEDKAMIKAEIRKEKMKEKMKEDVDALLSGENLSEEFKTKATTIFEAAVIARAEEIIASAEEQLTEQFETAIEQVKEELASKVDDYLNYMVEEWVKENELAIEKGLRAEIVEDFISGLKGLFEEHYIDIPEDEVDVVEELTNKVSELEDSLNEQIKIAIEMKKSLSESKKIEAIHTACEGLTQTQVEKMKSLAEGVDFTTEEDFVTKLDTLKESYFKSDVKVADNSAFEEVIVEEEKKGVKSSDPSMEIYAKTISQTLKS